MKIGIDPDAKKSGVAIMEDGKLTRVTSLPFMNLISLLNYKNQSGLIVYVEAGWLINKSNWHGGMSPGIISKIAKSVGMNHQTGILLVELLDYYRIPFELVKPTGKGKKLNHKQFCELTGWTGRTNADSRDAAMLIWS